MRERSDVINIIHALVDSLPREQQFEFIERAAIIEFDGKTTREDAERRSWEILRTQLQQST